MEHYKNVRERYQEIAKYRGNRKETGVSAYREIRKNFYEEKENQLKKKKKINNLTIYACIAFCCVFSLFISNKENQKEKEIVETNLEVDTPNIHLIKNSNYEKIKIYLSDSLDKILSVIEEQENVQENHQLRK